MKVLVTGSKGQVGRCLQDASKEHPEVQFVFTDKEELDITSGRGLKTYFENNSFDYCINCAAYTAVDLAETQREEAYLINAEAVENLAEACLETDCILIHISTDFVFDGTKTTPYTEDDEPNPINVYGASKLKGEEYVQQILTEYYIIRTSWVYSEYGGNFVKTMMRRGNEKEELNVVSDQIGVPTYAGDLAAFIITLISKETRCFGIINYSNSGALSWYDFAKAIMDEAGIAITVIAIPSSDYNTAAKRPSYSVLDVKKAAQTYNAKMVPWRDSLKKCVKILNR